MREALMLLPLFAERLLSDLQINPSEKSEVIKRLAQFANGVSKRASEEASRNKEIPGPA
jgi:hypothetical protein